MTLRAEHDRSGSLRSASGVVGALTGADEHTRYAQLLDQGFGVPWGRTFLDDFPVWRPELGAEVVAYGARVEGVLVAGASLRLAELAEASAERVGVIGAVVCAPEHQNRGLASLLVESLLVRAHREGACAVYLWSGQPTLYQRLGFVPEGEQVRIRLASLAFNRATTPQLRVGRGWSPALMQTLLRERLGGLRLRAQDERWFAEHRGVEWWWVRAGDAGPIIAYAAIHRGIDLAHYVHEWGGESRALAELLCAIRADDPEAMLLGSPAWLERWRAQGVLAALPSPHPTATEPLVEPLVLTCPLDPGYRASKSRWLWGLDGA